MFGRFGRFVGVPDPELSMGLDHDNSDEAVEPQELPEYDHSLFEEEGVDVHDD